MEGGAQGQVGGMEMGEGERKRLAAESRSWKCHGCGGSTNEDTLLEEARRCEEMERNGGPTKAAAKEQVPDELRFGFRDEMGKEQSKEKGKENEQPGGNDAKRDDVTEQRDNQHFVGPTNLRSIPSPVSLSPPPAPTIAPAQPLREQIPARTTSITQSTTDNGVPSWVDKAIAGLLAGLLVMVIKKIAI